MSRTAALAVTVERFGGGGVTVLLRDEFAVDLYTPERDDVVLAGPMCDVDGCLGGTVNNHPPRLCQGHQRQATRAGLSRTEFLADPLAWRRELYNFEGVFDFSPLPKRLRTELQFAVQCRHDERGARLEPHVFKAVVRLLATVKDESLLSRTPEAWFAAASWRAAGTFLKFARIAVELAERPTNLLERDLWVGADFNTVDFLTREHIRFSGIQPWLRDPVRRWALWRLNGGKRWKTVHMNVHAITLFSRYLDEQWPAVKSISALNRDSVHGFVAHLRGRKVAAQSLSDHTSSLRLFLDEYRIHDDWGPPLPSSAVLLHSEVVSQSERLPRPLSEAVMRQVEDPANLRRLPVHAVAAVLIGIRCGLRISSVLDLPFDCLHYDPSGEPTLVYRNVKRRDTERMLPLVHDDVVAAIRAQQTAVRDRYSGKASAHLFPREHANPDGRWHMSYTAITTSLERWIARCEMVDPQTGAAPAITFHQFRHTFATRLIAAGASEYFVSVLLDHEHTSTTRGYAMLADPQRREQFDRFSKVNNRGEVIDGWTAEHEWMKVGLNRAQATLANGYCGLPTQMTCEMRNACLNCDAYFITTKEFLPVHRQQLNETRKLIAVAVENGHARMAENNRQVEQTLERIIAAIDVDEDSDGAP